MHILEYLRHLLSFYTFYTHFVLAWWSAWYQMVWGLFGLLCVHHEHSVSIILKWSIILHYTCFTERRRCKVSHLLLNYNFTGRALVEPPLIPGQPTAHTPDPPGDNLLITVGVTADTFSPSSFPLVHLQASLGSHQYLFTVDVNPCEMPCLCLRHDVDALVWQPRPDQPTNMWEHIATFNALGKRPSIVPMPPVSHTSVCVFVSYL